MDSLRDILPLLIPLLVIQIGLIGLALRDLYYRERVRWGNKWIWVVIILLFDIVGPVVYFAVGRED